MPRDVARTRRPCMVRTMASGPSAGAGATSPSRRPPTPSGVLFFVHGANETSEGLVANLSRIEDQVRRRGWDVTVVAPEWRRRSDLRLGAWQKAIHRRGRPSPMPVPILRAGLRRDAVLKITTNYFEDRREQLVDLLGAQLAGRRHRLRVPSRVDPRGPQRRADARGGGGPGASGPAGRPEPRWHRPRRPAGGLAGGAGRGVRHGRHPGAAAVHLRRDPVDAVRRGRSAAPAGAMAQRLRHARLPVVPGRAAVPPQRSAWPAWSTSASARGATSRRRTALTGSWIRSGMPSPRRLPGGACRR